ncbi:MAG: hypothetical protein ACRCZF_08900 [Gemmataceae bacterium]
MPLAAILLLTVGMVPGGDLSAEIALLRNPHSSAAVRRAAWDAVVKSGPTACVPLLQAWPSDDPVTANWLHTALLAIATDQPAQLPQADLQQFLNNETKPGKARRSALAALEKAQPGIKTKLLKSWLNDPEFGTEAVTAQLQTADSESDPAKKLLLLQAIFAATTEIEQSQAVAKKLIAAGQSPDLVTHLGIIPQWQIVGPFPTTLEVGLKTSFPPEKWIDLLAEYEGKTGKIKWKPASSDKSDGRVEITKLGINPDDGAVAYATATLSLPAPAKLELRLAAVDNLTVWVNSTKLIERASDYRSMYRADRYRALFEFPAGKSTILIKLTKTRPEEVRGKPGGPAKWDFSARLVGTNQRGARFTSIEATK